MSQFFFVGTWKFLSIVWSISSSFLKDDVVIFCCHSIEYVFSSWVSHDNAYMSSLGWESSVIPKYKANIIIYKVNHNAPIPDLIISLN